MDKLGNTMNREEIQEFEHTPHPIEYKLYYSC